MKYICRSIFSSFSFLFQHNLLRNSIRPIRTQGKSMGEKIKAQIWWYLWKWKLCDNIYKIIWCYTVRHNVPEKLSNVILEAVWDFIIFNLFQSLSWYGNEWVDVFMIYQFTYLYELLKIFHVWKLLCNVTFTWIMIKFFWTLFERLKFDGF